MIRFLVRRLAQAIVVLWATSAVVFLLFFVGPGPNQVARTFAGRLGTAARIAQIKGELHLDQPLYLQYSHWAWNVLDGNLGYDYYKGESVISAIAQAAPATISLVLGAAVLWISYGIFSGFGGETALASGPGRYLGRAVLLLDAGIHPRLVADLDIRLQAQPGHHVLPVLRVRAHHGEPVPVIRAPHTPLAHSRPGHVGHLHAADPRVGAGRHGRGLHQDGSRQGHA